MADVDLPTPSGIVTPEDEGLVERLRDLGIRSADKAADRILALSRALADERKRVGELEAALREVRPYIECDGEGEILPLLVIEAALSKGSTDGE